VQAFRKGEKDDAMILAIINNKGGTGMTPSAPIRGTVRRGICAAFFLAVLPVPAHTLPPGHATDWSNRGFADRHLVRYAEADDANREAVRRTPPEAITWYNLGLAHVTGGRDAEAIAAFREAVRLNPDYADAWYLLGLAYAGSGDRISALECVGPLRRVDPARADALFHVVGPR